jgi:hypothetical protein
LPIPDLSRFLACGRQVAVLTDEDVAFPGANLRRLQPGDGLFNGGGNPSKRDRLADSRLRGSQGVPFAQNDGVEIIRRAGGLP